MRVIDKVVSIVGFIVGLFVESVLVVFIGKSDEGGQSAHIW